MISRNIQPLRKPHSGDGKAESPEMAALQALAGSCCSVCFQPLPPAPIGYDMESRGAKYVCCGVAHCPYCGASAKENCSHLAAKCTGGKWHISGLPAVPTGDLSNPNPTSPHSIIAMTEAFKQKHLGYADPILSCLFGGDWDGHTIRQIPNSMLIDWLVHPDVSEKVYTASGGANQYLFRESDAGIEEYMERFFHDLPNAFARLEAQPCPFTEYFQTAFALPENGSKTAPERINYLQYSPSSNYLVVLGRRYGEIWDTSNPLPKRVASFTATCNPNQEYVVADFQESDNTIRLWCDYSPGHLFRSYPVEIRAIQDARLLHTEVQECPPHVRDLSENRRCQSGILHGGQSDISTNGSKISLRPHTDAERKARYGFSIPLRRSTPFLSVASDGETFVIGSDRVFSFWRIPPDVMQQATPAD